LLCFAVAKRQCAGRALVGLLTKPIEIFLFSQVCWEMLTHSGRTTSLGILGFPSYETEVIVSEVADQF